MIISDLNQLEVVEGAAIVGGITNRYASENLYFNKYVNTNEKFNTVSYVYGNSAFAEADAYAYGNDSSSEGLSYTYTTPYSSQSNATSISQSN
ncbi:hypothetical protein [Brasilonema sp. UFV-L1]|uniref:hypothetical protein n=1 Tax=Brasilonema sp. UFV-L1 TaxID=2234130 RepID=UPI00145FB7C7|nr:hypothetical protein [Brasilonema sp. UFV-L1]NMG05767.1 hypothetical protein [Brasilonema sp. UFV-L1]